jgi:hypothetical protein
MAQARSKPDKPGGAKASAAKKEAAAAASIRYPYQYAVKILCTANIPGTSQTTPSLLPGAYMTLVNIHNPNEAVARIRKKLALTRPPAISAFIGDKLKPDQAVAVDCTEISQKYGLVFIHGAEGFLVIESTHSLDVVAVYTAGGPGGSVSSLAVERVPERLLEA